MDKILENKPLRRLFFICAALIILLSLFVRAVFFGPPHWGNMVGDMLDKFVISLATTSLLGCFVFYVTPRLIDKSEISSIPSSKINKMLVDAVQQSDLWMFKGATGRFVRGTVIPQFLERSQADRLHRRISLTLMNPENDQVCAAYTEYRKSVAHESEKDTWSTIFSKAQVVATIYKAFYYRSQAMSLISTEIILIDGFSAFRVDLSSSVAIVTKEDPKAPAIGCKANTNFYRFYEADIVLQGSQGKRIPFVEVNTAPDKVTLDDVRLLIDKCGLSAPTLASKEFLEAAVNAIKDSSVPYGKKTS